MKKKRSKKRSFNPFTIQKEKNSLPVVNKSILYSLLSQKKYDGLCQSLLDVLNYFQSTNFSSLDAESYTRLNEVVTAILTIFVDKDFQIPEKYIRQLLMRAHLFANMVALTTYKTTDHVLKQILRQPSNFRKILFLYTSRNEIQIDGQTLHKADPELANLWYFVYGLPTVGCVTATQQRNLLLHYKNWPEDYRPFGHRVSHPYFRSSYVTVDERVDKVAKQRINTGCKQYLKEANIAIENTPNPKSIAIVTSKWFIHSAVYKSSYPFLSKLKGKYKLTLIHTGPYEVHEEAREFFDEVKIARFLTTPDGSVSFDATALATNDFQVVYYPDVGMTDESVWLSNLRLAPIQITSYGHPISTFGSEIDYFIVGQDSEDLSKLQENYSEIPVVIPGFGCAPLWPDYEPKYPEKVTNEIRINCPWGPDKYNYVLLEMLRNIPKTVPNVKFRFYPSPGVHRFNSYLPFYVDLKQQMGDSMELHTDKEYPEYMQSMEYGAFAINSWPFGGFNTVVESLYLGKPVVTLEGNEFSNRVASALLHKVGLGELVTKTPQDFIAKCCEMAADRDYCERLTKQLREVDLKATIFDDSAATYFVKAIEFVIEHHKSLQELPRPVYVN